MDMKPRKFDDPLVLVGGGDIDWDAVAELRGRGFPLVAADGGANDMPPSEAPPEMIIGDLDSLVDRDRWDDRTQILHLEEQDSTDFEKCLYATAAPLYLAFGFLGRRLDHSLASLHVVMKYHPDKPVVLIDGVDLLTLASGRFEMSLPLGARISVYPMETVTFDRSEGLEYALDRLTMRQGTRIGTSNRVTADPVRIAVRDSGEAAYAVILSNNLLGNVLDMMMDETT